MTMTDVAADMPVRREPLPVGKTRSRRTDQWFVGIIHRSGRYEVVAEWYSMEAYDDDDESYSGHLPPRNGFARTHRMVIATSDSAAFDLADEAIRAMCSRRVWQPAAP